MSDATENESHNDLSEPLLSSSEQEDEVHQLRNNGELRGGEEQQQQEREQQTTGNPNNNPWKNRNVLLSLLLCMVSGMADSIWGTIVLSGFLLALGDCMGQASRDNTLVGAAEMVQGMTMLVTALPVGLVADKCGKSKVVRSGGLLMLLTIALTLWALVTVKSSTTTSDGEDEERAAATRSYYIMVTALGLWGVVGGISNGPAQALYADSIAQGKRSEMLTWLYTCYLLSSSTGPIVSIILLMTVSSNTEDWSINEIFPVFCVGVLLEIPAAILMFFFSDKHVIKEEVVAVQEEVESSTTRDQQQQQQGYEAAIASERGSDENDEDAAVEQSQQRKCCKCTLMTKACVPYFVFFSGLVISLGSGASVKYFPLFFKELGLTQAAVQALYLVMPLFISGLSFVAQRTSRTVGRIETTILFYIVGVSLLYYLTYLSQSIPTSTTPSSDDDTNSTNTTTLMIWQFGNETNDDDDDNNMVPDDDDDAAATTSTLWQENPVRVCWIVVIWWFRTGIMNSVYPLLESVLMDVVPSNQRARWKSLESIGAFGWTGSALVGGILSDSHSYQFTFVTTATLQLTGALLLIPIQPLVELEQSIEEEQAAALDEAATSGDDSGENDNPEATTAAVPAPATTPVPPEALRQPLLQNGDDSHQ